MQVDCNIKGFSLSFMSHSQYSPCGERALTWVYTAVNRFTVPLTSGSAHPYTKPLKSARFQVFSADWHGCCFPLRHGRPAFRQLAAPTGFASWPRSPSLRLSRSRSPARRLRTVLRSGADEPCHRCDSLKNGTLPARDSPRNACVRRLIGPDVRDRVGWHNLPGGRFVRCREREFSSWLVSSAF